MDNSATSADINDDSYNKVAAMESSNNNNNINNNNSVKPGRKFGLTGQRQHQQQQQYQLQYQQYQLQQQVNNFTGGGSNCADGRRMSVRVDEQRNSWLYSLSEQEMEDKYNAICLAIRTESLTLGQRLEHQHAERDLVENNLSQEVRVLHSLFVTLRQEVARSQTSPYRDGFSSGGWNEIFIKVANQVEAVHSSAVRISSSAETLGAVEYEARLSAAVQVLILYVDHIKRKWEREHHELEETKRILKESGVNVAQCLANLPERLAAAGSLYNNYNTTSSSSTGAPVSKRRASFPAAPLRRISLKPPPLVNAITRVSALLEPTIVSNSVRSPTTIAEEREDADSDHPSPSPTSSSSRGDQQQEAGADGSAPAPPLTAFPSPSAPQSQSHPPPPPPPHQPLQQAAGVKRNNKATAAEATDIPVTTRRRGVGGGLKSHSWSSSHPTSLLLDRRESSECGRPSSAKPMSWLSRAGQWSHMQYSQWRKTAAIYRSTYTEQWATLRQKKLLLLRYSASACFLLAALVSIVVTFVPYSSSSFSSASSSSSSSSSGASSSIANASAVPGRALGR